MKIYIASSWRNKSAVRAVAATLKHEGHEVFDFTNPGPHTVLPDGFHWSEIDPQWQGWTKEQYRSALEHDLAVKGLNQDFSAMQWADACVAVQPFGRSASLELGWFIGQGKPAFVLLHSGEPELMFGLATLCLDLDEVIARLNLIDDSVPVEEGVSP